MSAQEPENKPPARVVIEDSDEARAWLDQAALKAAGYDVEICNGREAYPGRQCLLARDGWCPFLDGADAVVCHLSPGDKIDVVRRIRDQYPSMVVVLDPADTVESEAAQAEMLDLNPVERPSSEPALARDIKAALLASREPPRT